ncbi:SDR family oxidoreductase [Actinoplanes sp. NPDC051851]|uniref:SDR family oxidoreductase n=1 Tax=Actinoplanes sp. NPDC051851 TaxID=3154753 RepID=UPI00344171D2
MRVFVTGASGWIGSATVTELLAAGHRVTGLARSDDAATTVAALGAEVRRGSLDDLDVLRAAAAESDGVVHMGYNHDFSRMADAAATDQAAIAALGEALDGTGGALVIASGLAGLGSGGLITEEDPVPSAAHPRAASAALALSFAERGVRPSIVRFAPTVHGPGDHGFVATLARIAREKGFSAYVGDGSNRWPAVHRADAAVLVRRAVEDAPPASIVHAIAEEGVPTRTIAEAIGEGLGIPSRSIPAEQAPDHFGWMAMFFSADLPASSELTRARFSWTPTHPTLLDDLKAGYYTS